MSLIKFKMNEILPNQLINILKFFNKFFNNFMFDRAMKNISEDTNLIFKNCNNNLSKLIYNWNNIGYSAQEEYLTACLQYAKDTDGPILECGSGITTILLGVIAQEKDNIVWTLEHNERCGRRIKKYINKYNIKSVKLCIKDLKDYGNYHWYSPPLDEMPNCFSMVVCDGPPSTTVGGKYGLLPIMRAHLNSNCIILVDDAERDQEKEIVSYWAKHLGTNIEKHGVKKPFFQLVVP